MSSQIEIQKSFLDSFKSWRVGTDQNFTHNGQYAPKGRFFISNQNISNFFTLLCNLIKTNGESGLMENYQERMPIIVDNDFDFECKEPDDEPDKPILYEPWVITEQIKAYNEAITNCLDVQGDEAYYCFVLEKPCGYMKKGNIHNGFHLHYPFCVTDADDQKTAIRPQVKNILKQRGILERMQCKDVKSGGWDNILDDGLPAKTWVMYGCRRDALMKPYKVTAIYDKNLNKVSLKDVITKVGLQKCTYVSQNILPLSYFEKEDIEYYLPIFLSVRGWDIYTPLKNEIRAIVGTSLKKPKLMKPRPALTSAVSSAQREEITIKFKELKELVEMLSRERSDNHDSWMRTGWCLFNACRGSAEGLQLWIDFSKRSPKFQDGECEEKWCQMSFTELSVASLKYWAKMDSPELYAKYCSSSETDLMRKALSLTNFDVAKMVHGMFSDRFVCASTKHKIWYEFKGHRWRLTEKGISLYDKLSNDVVSKLEKWRTRLSQEVESVADQEEKDRLNDRIKNLHTLMCKLKDTSFKNRIMEELSVLFFDQSFIEKLDDNPDLLVCKNGVLDIKLYKLRKGEPEDFCSKCMPIEFPENFTEETPEVIEVRNFLRKVYTNDGVRKYFLRFSASTLRGGNISKLLPQWYGDGDNAKSGITSLFDHMYGPDYCVKFPSNFFSGKNGNIGAATPETERAPGARIGFIQEPDGQFNASKCKEYTGGDTVYSRGMYKEGRNVKLMLKFVIVCNKPLEVPSYERALFNRLRLLPHSSFFSRDHKVVPATEEEQYKQGVFKADLFYQDRYPKLAPAFLWILWKEYPEFIKPEEEGGGLQEPPEVKQATEEYKVDCDIYSEFIGDKLEKCEGNKITSIEMFKEFSAWFKQMFPSDTLPKRTFMRESLNRIFKKPIRTKDFVDYKFKDTELL